MIRGHLTPAKKGTLGPALTAAPNERWVTDITYIRTGESWLYLAAVIDLDNNVVIGGSMSARQDRHLVLKAVLMANWQREDNMSTPDPECLFSPE